MKTLYVGFRKFAQHPINPSEQILSLLKEKGKDTLLLDVVYHEDGDALMKKAKGYDAIIILALSPYAKEPVLERYAYNERDSVQADNKKVVKIKEAIEKDGPASRTTDLEVSSLSQSLIREGEEAAIGLDPGRFVANECYYRCLKEHPHTLLIHVPLDEDHPIKETLTVALLAESYIAGL